MSTRVSGSVLLLIALVFSLNVGAQDPPQPTPAQATQVDLSGTYTGTFDCEPAGLMGESTLTITGNQFTTADGKTGRIVVSPSGGYTAVAFQVGEMVPSRNNRRDCRSGNNATDLFVACAKARHSIDFDGCAGDEHQVFFHAGTNRTWAPDSHTRGDGN
jgi:hypothetical protein